MRGRKPDALAVRRGASTADISTTTAATMEEGALVKPESVSLDPYQSEIWDTLVGTGAAFQEADSPMLQSLVFNIAIVEDCRKHIYDEDGTMRVISQDEDEYGNVVARANPYIKIMNDAEKLVMKMSQELGLTRFARARLGLTQACGQAAQISVAEQIDRAIRGRS